MSNKYYYIKEVGDIENIVQGEGEIPKPGQGEVLVKIHATSLNYRDTVILYNTYKIPSLDKLIPLSDAAGEVVDIGDGVKKWKKGDRVISLFRQGHQVS